MFRKILPATTIIILLILFTFSPLSAGEAKVLTAADVLEIQGCSGAVISPGGQWIAYNVRVPRKAIDKPGSAYSELYVVNTKTREVKPFITGKVSIGSLSWSPDGKYVFFTTRRGEKAKNQVWKIPISGGEAVQVTHSKTGVMSYRQHPTENKIAYTTVEPKTAKEKKLAEKGYGFIFYEENLKHRNLYLLDLDTETGEDNPKQLTKGQTVWSFVFSNDGKQIAAQISPKNLVDHSYMFRRIFLLDIGSGKLEKLVDNPGKLGNMAFSPDGTKLAYTGALERKDHAVSQVFVVDIKSGEQKNLTPPDFKGHVQSVYWKDAKTIMYVSGEGVWPKLNQVAANGGERKILLDSSQTGVVFRGFHFTKDAKYAAFVGNSSHIPGDLYYFKLGKSPVRLTDLNPWLKERLLGLQKVIRYKARDDMEIEGILMLPAGYAKGTAYPLIMVIHGGPESHYSNGWLTRYSSPGQVLAGKGYAVFYPNYRASTGYGVKFALAGYMDAAGKEFDDIADGIDHLVKEGIADRERVGLGGGSYGGYAAAWFASYYTKYVRAVSMFVGISNVTSKRGTTDIPYEELYVHSGELLEKMWESNLKSSPVYWAHQSKTAVLITGGASDTRVHPSQSMEFYRRLKMNDHPAVRLVQYPGEGHGNRKQPGRIDLLYRILNWYDWYVKDKKPLDGPMPPLDISDKYGLDLD